MATLREFIEKHKEDSFVVGDQTEAAGTFVLGYPQGFGLVSQLDEEIVETDGPRLVAEWEIQTASSEDGIERQIAIDLEEIRLRIEDLLDYEEDGDLMDIEAARATLVRTVIKQLYVPVFGKEDGHATTDGSD